jgi:ABC-2 type transport system permease protein
MAVQIWAVSRKELRAYFGSPLALIFIGVFLAASLFIFFWVETFFVRNVAEVRPLFRWMPVLMIFLVATLTMRQWSEEQRSGTFELLLTLPVKRTYIVIGKFLAVMALLVLSLVLTLSLPVTVSILGDLDWGPVIGGYVAAVLMAAAYVSIGLFVSSRTDNQIVSLILTALLCGALYLVGTSGVTNFAGETTSNLMRAISSGGRFESIERGVIDLRDLVYYVSITVFFLLLNVVSLDTRRWGKGSDTSAYRRNSALAVALAAVHLVALNAWIYPLAGLRIDLTADRQFSLSDTTRDIVRNLEEPLLMRGYFSEETHPLLTPLVPNIRDLLREYEIASDGRIEIEVVDPRDDEEIEAEASRSYGIHPNPFAVAERHGAGVVNSYFTILVRYGDEFVTLGFDDLVQTERRPTGQLDIKLRDLEYDLTRAIKRTVDGFQNQGAVFSALEEPLNLTLFATVDMLPEEWQRVPERFEWAASNIAEGAGGKLRYSIVDPDAPGSLITRAELAQLYGLAPIPISVFSQESLYLHMVLEKGAERFVVYPGGEMGRADVRSAIDSMIKRAVPGFLKTVGLWVPTPVSPQADPLNPFAPPPTAPPPQLSSWNLAEERLTHNYTLTRPDLKTGRVPPEIDVLVVIAGQGMTPAEEFAIDQFLMKGGAVIVAAGGYVLSQQQFAGGFIMERVGGQLREMLSSYGVTVDESFVLDTQNESFPVQVRRMVNGIPVFELESLSYPHWVDIRRDGMDTDNLITSNLPGLTLQWVSPLQPDPQKNAEREVATFVHSTEESWVRPSPDVNPDLEAHPELGFPIEGDQGPKPLAVSITGSFDSFYKGRANPFEELAAQVAYEEEHGPPPNVIRIRPLEPPEEIPVTIEESPASARLVVIGSTEFLDDFVLGMSRGLSPNRYLLNLQFLENTVDWAVEDAALLALRSRGTVARFLKPLEDGEQTLYEAVNYGVALAALIAIGIIWTLRRRTERPMSLVED